MRVLQTGRMRTERQKMLAGEFYDPLHAELVAALKWTRVPHRLTQVSGKRWLGLPALTTVA